MATANFCGPINLVVFAFGADADIAPGLALLLARAQRGDIELLDLEVIGQAGGAATPLRLDGLVTDGFDPHVFDGIESGILDADDLSMIAEELGPAQVAVVVVYEDRVLADVAAAWETAGGRELWSGGVDVAGLDESLASAGEDEN